MINFVLADKVYSVHKKYNIFVLSIIFYCLLKVIQLFLFSLKFIVYDCLL